MAISDQIQNYNDGLLDAYNAVQTKGGTIPANKNLVNLPDAIESISGGGSEPVINPITITENGTYTAPAGVDGYSPVTVNVAGATEPYIEETYDANGDLIDVVFHGYTRIRKDAFYGASKLAITELPDEITFIATEAFRGCSSMALTHLPSNLTSIEVTTFYDCQALAISKIPDAVTKILRYGIYNAKGITSIEMSSSLQTVDTYGLSNCPNLTTITFVSKPTSLSNQAFYLDNNLTTINVPWSEGEVANAPWGATNATINYNYTGGND